MVSHTALIRGSTAKWLKQKLGPVYYVITVGVLFVLGGMLWYQYQRPEPRELASAFGTVEKGEAVALTEFRVVRRLSWDEAEACGTKRDGYVLAVNVDGEEREVYCVFSQYAMRIFNRKHAITEDTVFDATYTAKAPMEGTVQMLKQDKGDAPFWIKISDATKAARIHTYGQALTGMIIVEIIYFGIKFILWRRSPHPMTIPGRKA